MKSLSHALLFLAAASFAMAAPTDDARQILDQSGVQGGLIVHLGCGDGALTAELRTDDRFTVFGLAETPENVANARQNLRKRGVYGPVSVDLLEGAQLPFVDDFVNLIVVENPAKVSESELTRVLCPYGVAMIREGDSWTKTTKPWPSEIDDWTHYFHGPNGNAVAQDERVGPPNRLQWIGSPRWSRHHDRMASMSALVSGKGRLFYIMDEGSRISIQLPSKWMLVARDGFNSTILWKKPIANWHDQLWPLKSGPTQLAKRLITDGDRVFAPLALGAPVTCFNAATGEEIATYEATKGMEEMVLVDGKLFVLANPAQWALKDFRVKLNTGDQGRVSKEFGWNKAPRQLVAIDTANGETLWSKETKVSPLSLVADATQVAFHDGEAVVRLNPATGEESWRNTEASRRSLFEFNYGPRLVLHENVVLYAGGDGKKMGLDAKTGKTLWTAGDPRSGYKSPQDLMVASGLVWTAPLTSGGDSGVFTGLDPLSGEVRKEFPPTVETYWFHHRCYIAKATEKFLMPSRTGIEFIDHEKEHWDINHWVRGGCLYGVMPANGLTYAPPHNCACYPEAKLFGFNALAAYGSKPEPLNEAARLEKGPAFGREISAEVDELDWPTYRHDKERSGYTDQKFDGGLNKAWEATLSGKLSAPTISGGRLYVSQIDAHTVHALDAKTGETAWSMTVGGRVDSPPTIWNGRAIFGCADGNVYCVAADSGELAWRFRAAPANRRTMVFEQLESLWPVPGSVLVEEGVASFVAGRSAFLDGGMHFYRLKADTGEVVAHKIIDDRDPETGGDLQDRIQTLQMPVALNDILSSDGNFTYLRSQKIADDGTRVEIGPISGNAALLGGTQAGEGAHVFAPMGFLDDTWFHRSYWVYGRNFAGGHNGYHQAGKYAPAGRILVFDKENVYGYGREPKYLKWTTTLEHQLFSASREVDDNSKAAAASGKRRGKAPNSNMPVAFRITDRIDPSNKALTAEAWVMADAKSGVVLAHGGPQNGFALTLAEGKPQFQVRADAELSVAQGAKQLSSGWHHLVGVLGQDGGMKLYVDGKEAASAKSGGGLIAAPPAQTFELAGDGGASVGEYAPNKRTPGLIDEVAIYHRELSPEEIASRFETPGALPNNAAIACNFNGADANDDSGGKNHGVLSGVDFGKGISGSALWIQRGKAYRDGPNKSPNKTKLPANNTFVSHNWANRVPIYTRAMALAGDTLVIAGPPDIIDEEYTFERLTEGDESIQEQLAAQDRALAGEDGATMHLVSTKTGERGQELDLESPPVWDGMAVAQGKLFVCGEDGKVRCFAGK